MSTFRDSIAWALRRPLIMSGASTQREIKNACSLSLFKSLYAANFTKALQVVREERKQRQRQEWNLARSQQRRENRSSNRVQKSPKSPKSKAKSSKKTRKTLRRMRTQTSGLQRWVALTPVVALADEPTASGWALHWCKRPVTKIL